MRHEQKLKRMKEDSQRALDKIERHKQAPKGNKKILEYVFTQVNVNIDRVEAKRREERKQKIQHQKTCYANVNYGRKNMTRAVAAFII